MTDNGLGEILFHDFVNTLAEKGLIFNEGQMIDASFVLAPKQRNTREENEKIKKGESKELWKDKPQKKNHKDIDTRWTQKGGQDYFGYKAHAKVDKKSKFVKRCLTTSASVHDSQALPNLFDESDRGQEFYADSAYVGQQEILKQYDLKDKICDDNGKCNSYAVKTYSLKIYTTGSSYDGVVNFQFDFRKIHKNNTPLHIFILKILQGVLLCRQIMIALS